MPSPGCREARFCGHCIHARVLRQRSVGEVEQRVAERRAGKHRIEVPPETSLRSTQRSQPEIALPSSSSILKSRFCAQRGGGRTRRRSPRQVGAQHDEEAAMASARRVVYHVKPWEREV